MTARGAVVARLTVTGCTVAAPSGPGTLTCWPVVFGVALPPAGLAANPLRATEPVVRSGRPLVGAAKPGELTPRQPGSGTVVLDSVGGVVAGLAGWCIGAAGVLVRHVGPATMPLPSPQALDDLCQRLMLLLVADVANLAGATAGPAKPALVDRPPVGRPPPRSALGRVLAGPALRVLPQVVPDEAVRLDEAREEARRLHRPVLVPTIQGPAPSVSAVIVATAIEARLGGPGADGTAFTFERPLVDASGKAVAELAGRCEVTVLHPASSAGA